MSMPKSRLDREQDKFVSVNDLTHVRTIVYSDPDKPLDINFNGAINADNNLNDGFGNPITSTLNNITQRSIHALTPNNQSNTFTLNSLASFGMIEVTGLNSTGFQLYAGTFQGSLIAECSLDNGFSWVDVNFFDPKNSAVIKELIFLDPTNDLTIVSVVPIGGTTHIRIRPFTYVSGSANGLLSASQISGVTGSITASAFSIVMNYFITIPSNTPTLLLSANTNRKFAYISNTSPFQLNIQLGSTVGLTANTGLIIPKQSRYELQGNNLYTGDVYGFSASEIIVSASEGVP